MKYLKAFENNKTEKKYWLIPTDDRFEESLKYIKCKDDNIIDNPVLSMHKYIFVHSYVEYKGNRKNIIAWSWNPYTGEKRDVWSENRGYEFQGLINISEYELDINKYNI